MSKDNEFGDQYVKMPTGKPLPKITKLSISEKQETPKQEVVKKPIEQPKIQQQTPVAHPEKPKVVLPKFIKKDAELEKEIVKIIQEVPKEELERILKPTQLDKDRLSKMDFQSRTDMSDEEKKDFIEQIQKREPEPEVAQMNGALVWKWQKNRKQSDKK